MYVPPARVGQTGEDVLLALGDEEVAVLSVPVAGAVALAEGVAASEAAGVALDEPEDATPVPMMLDGPLVSLDGLDPVGCETAPVPKEDVVVPFEEPVPRKALVVLTAARPVDKLAAGVVWFTGATIPVPAEGTAVGPLAVCEVAFAKGIDEVPTWPVPTIGGVAKPVPAATEVELETWNGWLAAVPWIGAPVEKAVPERAGAVAFAIGKAGLSPVASGGVAGPVGAGMAVPANELVV